MTRYVTPWGCWKCGEADSRVVDSDVDDDGVRVRLRQCTGCAAYWDTEELRIAKDAFYARSTRRRQSERRRRSSVQLRCRVCHGPFRGGTYAKHKAEPHHANEMARRHAARKQRQKAISRRWYEQDRRNRAAMRRLEAVA